MVSEWKISIVAFSALMALDIGNANANVCGNNTSSEQSTAACKLEQTGLSGLFKSTSQQEAQIPSELDTGSKGIFLPYSRVIEDNPKNPIRPRKPNIQANPKSARLPRKNIEVNFKPHDLPTFGQTPKLIAIRSDNKRLSKGSHDGAATLMMRCRDGALNVLFDFPGYPMNLTPEQKSVAIQLDGRQQHVTQFSNSNQLSVIGIWEPDYAKKFVKRIVNSKHMRIVTKDAEANSIVADFKMEASAQKVNIFQQNCSVS